ncbi:hypothetical protein ElyMa_004680900, partial [Elysia marginata]
MTAVDTDIDSFIQQQKAKLANERNILNNDNVVKPGTPIESGLPLTNKGHHDRQRELALQRRQEYNDMLKKKGLGKARDVPRPGHSDPRPPGLNIGNYEDDRKVLDRERQRDYQQYQEQQRAKASSRAQAVENQPNSRAGDRPSGVLDYNSGKFSYQQSRIQLAEERRKEYNDLLRSKREKGKEKKEVEFDSPTIIPFDRAEQDRARLRALEEERRQEYNQVKAKLRERKQQREPTPQDDYGLPVGEYEKQKQKDRDQREYREMLQRQQEEQKRLVLIQEMGVPPEKVPYILDQEKRNLGHQPEPAYDSVQAQEKRVQFESPNLEDRYSYQRRLQSPPPPQQQRHSSPLLDQQYYQSPSPTRALSTAAGHPPWHRDTPPPEQEQGSGKRPKWGPPEPLGPLNLSDVDKIKQDMTEYRRRWFELKGKHLEPGPPRKQWGAPLKLSPRGTLDTDRLILEAQREKEMNEYKESWKRMHGGEEPSPRRAPAPRGVDGPYLGLSDHSRSVPAPAPALQRQSESDEYRRRWQQHHVQGQQPAPYASRTNPKAQNMPAALDTESIIRQVEKEKRELEEKEARQNNNVLVGGGGGRGTNRGGQPPRISGSPAPAVDKDAYKRQWEQQNSQRRAPVHPKEANSNKRDADVPRLDTDALIAEVTAEKLEEENRKLRQERQQLEAAKRAGIEPHKQTPAQRSQRQIESRLAEARREVDDYRSRWKAQNSEEQPPDPEVDKPVRKTIKSALEEDFPLEVQLPQRRHYEEENLMLGSEEHETRREKLRRQRHQDMRDFQAKQVLQSSSPAPSTSVIGSDAGSNSGPSLGRFRNSADYRNYLARQRNQEYNNWLYKRQRDEPSPARAEASPSQLSVYSDARPRWFREETNTGDRLQRETNSITSSGQHPEGSRHTKREVLNSPGGLPVGGYEEHRRKLNDERRKEYMEHRKRKAGQQVSDQNPGASKDGLLIRADPGQVRLQQLREERNKEYNQLLAQKRNLPTPERYGLPREVDEAEDYGLFHNLGAKDKSMPRLGDPPASQLNLTGQDLVDPSIRRGYQPRSLREQTDEYKAATIGSNESDAAKLQKIKERNNEYNQFLASKAERQGQRKAANGSQDQGNTYATIPGLRYSTSAQ